MSLRLQALEAHQADSFDQAESLYREALSANPEDIEVLHMLGVVLYQKLRLIEALERLWTAAEKTGWRDPNIRHNVGLVIAHLLAHRVYSAQGRLLDNFRSWDALAEAAGAAGAPSVSVIVRTHNDARDVGQAIASVLAQTYPHIDMIVVDDGSQDDTVASVRASLASSAFPARFIALEDWGTPRALNEGAALARGSYLAFLDSDGFFAPDRIETMVAEVAANGALWGFSLVTTALDRTESSRGPAEARDFHQELQLAGLGRLSNSFAFLGHNVAVSTGNLFVERSLFGRLGGFRNLGIDHDWDFCLRAGALAEPKVVRKALYTYPAHDASTIDVQRPGDSDRIERIIAEVFARCADGPCVNPLAPQWLGNRALLVQELLGSGMGRFVPVKILRSFAEQARAEFPFRGETPAAERAGEHAEPDDGPQVRSAGIPVSPVPPPPPSWAGGDERDPGEPTAGYVLCIENNAIREQALLLCESIRRFGGRYRNSRILAVAPRPGLGVDRRTAARLAELDVEYIEEVINTACPQYGSANRVFSAAWAEKCTDVDYLFVLDSDTVFLDEPVLPLAMDVGVRPEDTKGSGTRGPGDHFEQYWRALADLCSISLDRLPFLETSVEKVRVRASYNGGLVVARRAAGLLTAWADLFARSVAHGLRPYRGTGNQIIASTGFVGRAASEYWGSNQAVLALVIWANTNRVMHYPMSYNVPLHLLAKRHDILPEWTVDGFPVHVHYHWMFNAELKPFGLVLLDKLGVPGDRLAWLSRRAPVSP